MKNENGRWKMENGIGHLECFAIFKPLPSILA